MSHNCHHTNCGHENSKESYAKGNFSLFPKIDLDNVQCLNEMVDDSGRQIFKPWDLRLDKIISVESDVDSELLFNVPFIGIVKLKSLVIIGGEGSTHPLEIKLICCNNNLNNVLANKVDRTTMTFDDTTMEPDQGFMLHPDPMGEIDYTVKASIFSSIHHLTIYIPKNMGADHTKVYYIGLFGDFLRPFREKITICNYESSANPCDHRVAHDLLAQFEIR